MKNGLLDIEEETLVLHELKVSLSENV